MFAKFEVRRLELPAARKVLGTAIGLCPKEALFKGYIDLEVEVNDFYFIFRFYFTNPQQQLREFDRARTLYEKYLEVSSLSRFQVLKKTSHAFIPVRPLKLTRMDQICRARVPTPRLRPHSRYLRARDLAVTLVHARDPVESVHRL